VIRYSQAPTRGQPVRPATRLRWGCRSARNAHELPDGLPVEGDPRRGGLATRPTSSGRVAAGRQWSRGGRWRVGRRRAIRSSTMPHVLFQASGDPRVAPPIRPNSARTTDGELRPRRARDAGRRGSAGRAGLRQRHRRAAAPRLAGTTPPGPMAAGSVRVPGADGPGWPRQAVDRDAHAAHLGHPAGVDSQRDRVRGADPGSPPAAVQRERQARHRAGLPHALGVPRPLRPEGGAAARCQQPPAGPGRRRAAERVDVRRLLHDRQRPAAHAGRRAALPALRPA
jgi:hypothetical protein